MDVRDQTERLSGSRKRPVVTEHGLGIRRRGRDTEQSADSLGDNGEEYDNDRHSSQEQQCVTAAPLAVEAADAEPQKGTDQSDVLVVSEDSSLRADVANQHRLGEENSKAY